MKNIIGICLLLTVTFFQVTGCGSSVSDSQSATVSKQDFSATGSKLDQTQFLSDLGWHRDLLTYELVKGTFNSGLLNFIDEGIENGTGCDPLNTPNFLKNNKAEFNLNLSADYLACFGNIALPSGANLASMVEMVSIEQAIFSQNNNPVDVSGQTWWDVAFSNYDIDKINFKSAYVWSGSNQGIFASFTNKYAVTASDDFNKACIIQDGLITNCTIQYLDGFSGGGFNNTDVVTFEYQDVVLTASPPTGFNTVYFASGTVKFKVNNWTGTLVYTATDVAPTYNATDGVKSIQGTLEIF